MSNPTTLHNLLIFSPLQKLDNVMLRQDLARLLRSDGRLTATLPNTFEGLLIVDCREVSAQALQQWLSEWNAKEEESGCVLIHVRPNSDYERLIDWPQIKGIVPRGTPRQTLLKGLKSVARGELWFSRRQCQDFLQRRRYQPQHSTLSEPMLQLTQRETQMLQCLYAGLSNNAIANQMGLSEHTIKSHMYNLYKKLGVKSRLEASNWMRDQASQLSELLQA